MKEEDEKDSFYEEHENMSKQELLIDILYELKRISHHIKLVDSELQAIKMQLKR